jgi:hypothetical protein
LVVASSANCVQVADKTNYSGKYSLQVQKPTSGIKIDSTIEVVQNEDSVEITRSEQGRRTTNRYPLNGSEGNYTSPGGVPGKCKAALKGKYLVLESVVMARPQPSASPVRMHTKERWQLSADSKILTIKSDEDFPDFPGDISAISGAYGSGTEKYARTENP